MQRFQSRLGEMLRNREVSLAMLFHRKGRIMWSFGRCVQGRDVMRGRGFSRRHIEKVLSGRTAVEAEDVIVDLTGGGISESAAFLNIRSLLIIAVSESCFFYVDSGTDEGFSQKDKQQFRILGSMVGDIMMALGSPRGDLKGLTGKSPAIRSIREKIPVYAMEKRPVLLLGETGVGKSRVARLIHRCSGRKGKFVTVSSPAIPADLFERELFGHARGAFTGAAGRSGGFVEQAEGGTLFFDEICDIPLKLQAKLLHLIDTHRYSRLGEPEERRADVRIVAATNHDPEERIQKKRFRKDLYYRLNSLEVVIPPLRERREDIPLLVEEGKDVLKSTELSGEFLAEMLRYHWPGNVRELFSLLLRIGTLSRKRMERKDFKKLFTGRSRTGPTLTGNIKAVLHHLEEGQNFWKAVKEPFMSRDINRGEVKEVVRSALARGRGSYRKALKYLNLRNSEHKKFLDFINNHNLR